MKAYFAKEIYGEDKVYQNSYLLVENGVFKDIVEKAPEGVEIISYPNCRIIPGIINIHAHGCMGYSATCKDQDELLHYTQGIAKFGVTGVFATTQELETMSIVADTIDQNIVKGARILGIHAEGPYRAEAYMGASKGFVWPKPSIEYTQKMLDAAKGHLKYMSVSTEVEGVKEIMPMLLENGVVVAGGHTGCTYEEMKEGISWGLKSFSHFGNAVKMVHQRDANAAGAVLLDENMNIELNCDHVHVCPETVDIFMRFKSPDKIILIDDLNEAACLPAGRYFLRGRIRIIDEEGVVRIEDGTLSGGGKCIIIGLRNMVERHNVSLAEGLKMTSYNAAKLFGLFDKKGSIKPGKDADFVILNDNWEVEKTIVEGQQQYDISQKDDFYNPDIKRVD